MDGTGWSTVEEVSGRMEGFHPKRRRELGVNEHDPNDVVGCAEKAFGFTVLRRRVRA